MNTAPLLSSASFFFWCVWIDESLPHACHGSLSLTTFKDPFFFLVFISLALTPTYYLYLLTSLNVDHFSFHTCEIFDYLSVFCVSCFWFWVHCFLFTNSNCVEMRRLNIFSEGLEDIFKGSFSFLCHSYLKFLLICIQVPLFFSPKSLKPVISLDLCYILFLLVNFQVL